ncbi:hypothetical protein ACMYR3_04145 [Ampullimonas aquatilis]|uniref:hypothetical protein n=1 Tax=Ampullimonas aquatilis TaxID=1341549 RepID=UPI003C7677A7
MNLFTGETSEELFGGEAPASVVKLLREATKQASHSQSEALLWTANVIAPDCLPVYFALYKFYFYKGKLAAAEDACRRGLKAAARKGDFNDDWANQKAGPHWNEDTWPRRFYLFSLKALSFILLRQGREIESHQILNKLEEIDSGDRVGAVVIRDIAAGLKSKK